MRPLHAIGFLIAIIIILCEVEWWLMFMAAYSAGHQTPQMFIAHNLGHLLVLIALFAVPVMLIITILTPRDWRKTRAFYSAVAVSLILTVCATPASCKLVNLWVEVKTRFTEEDLK